MTGTMQMTLDEALAQAAQLMRQGSKAALHDARVLCLHVLEVSQFNGNALYFLGVIDFNNQEYFAAADYLRRAIDVNPAVPSPHFFLGCALMELHQYGEAEAALRRAVILQPKQPDFWFDFARVLIEQGKFNEAIKYCNAAIEVAPSFARVHILLARAMQGLGRTGDAISVFRRAIEIDPNDAKSHFNLAIFLRELGLASQAEASLRNAISLQADFEPAQLLLAETLRSQGNTKGEISQLNATFTRNPNIPDLDIQIGVAKQVLSIETRALEMYPSFKPVFILAPVARCGTTLLQRLFNSSSNFLMFGENEDITSRLPGCISFALSKVLEVHDLSTHRNLKKNLTEDWVAGLFPGRSGEYLDLSLRNFYEVVGHYQVTADKLGRAWGIKVPHVGQLGMLRSLLPKARFVCIYRSLFDVARSFKARGWLVTNYDVIKLAIEWQDGIRQMFASGSHSVMLVKYESLVTNSDEELARIEEFAQVSVLDRTLMGVKVNGDEPDRHGRFVPVYRPPKALTQEEHELLVKHGRGMLDHLGYIDTSHAG